MNGASPTTNGLARVPQLLRHGSVHGLLGLVILWADYLTGPYLLFPILFVGPVALAAWFHGPRWAYALAVGLPLGRLAIAVYVDVSGPPAFAVLNAAIRISLLLLLAFLVARTARQTRELQDRVSGLVRICAWSHTIEYQGEWLSFEQYLKKRFNLEATHGVAPGEARKLLEALRKETSGTGGSGRN